MISMEKAAELAKIGYWNPKVDEKPSLAQLLAEIERRGWNADSVSLKDGGYGCDIYWLSATVQTIYQTFAGKGREDAAADALIWIKRKGAGK